MFIERLRMEADLMAPRCDLRRPFFVVRFTVAILLSWIIGMMMGAATASASPLLFFRSDPHLRPAGTSGEPSLTRVGTPARAAALAGGSKITGARLTKRLTGSPVALTESTATGSSLSHLRALSAEGAHRSNRLVVPHIGSPVPGSEVADHLGVRSQIFGYDTRARVTTSLDVVATKTPGTPKSPVIDPAEVVGKTPAEIDALAKQKGLIPKGPNPSGGKGAYVDPVTGEQRILCHPDGCGGGHVHVNDPSGQRLGVDGKPVPPESPGAHLPGDFK